MARRIKPGVKMLIVVAVVALIIAVGLIVSSLLPVSASISSDKSSYAFGDTLQLEAIVKNNSLSPKTFTFSNGCNAGSLFIDDQELIEVLMCTQAITSVMLSPFGSKSYEYSYTLVERPADQTYNLVNTDGQLEINSGEHTLYLVWQDITSGPITIKVAE